MKTIGYAAHSPDAMLVPFNFERRALRSNDVAIEILYCGICHSDLHQVKNDWEFSQYPMVPGHEIVGKVIDIGSEVKKYKIGDNVAIGCMVDSCLKCDQCKKGEEQFCREGNTQTYNTPDRISGQLTFGGYSKHIVTREEFVLSVPDTLDISRAAPILCAGITTFSPLRNYQVGPNSHVGVIGLGGLGHMAVKLAKAMGASVTVLTHSERKLEKAKALGANNILLSTDEDTMLRAANSLDIIINTIPVKHDITPYIPLLDIKGTLVMVGQVGPLDEPNIMPLILGNRSIAGSVIGGISQTQEVLDFCAEHNIHPECEMIRMDQINDAFMRLKKGDVSHRIVIDMSTLELA
ncbi:NAD(P)-dependent alcohol dehydrogenase [Legionella sp. 27cVA30]|uniref:NAD(P)-dependent alcohol dehydrogenase n=1 Tax=Legionella TaxID=445 RepID=UPI000F8D830D|nr:MULTISPECIES: NAD(P)-dependent alcohol dehydrogenase [Legionella]MCP0913248.1 NAD(P)-dependent alcohol dehydrogenase [Legionella sp. 27cVA30]RUR12734.1 NAD(P)-dependent alcohol dehydrogenase [Legionella septentrionalis]